RRLESGFRDMIARAVPGPAAAEVAKASFGTLKVAKEAFATHSRAAPLPAVVAFAHFLGT
ncbi:hypothetical protein ABT256_39400, partial [Amycolatopsis japonica]|uniref:hypothetical protein n=1 Tax=Amycolatopsis japonica TaxID=208439 RepID=UPI003323C843